MNINPTPAPATAGLWKLWSELETEASAEFKNPKIVRLAKLPCPEQPVIFEFESELGPLAALAFNEIFVREQQFQIRLHNMHYSVIQDDQTLILLQTL
eukprot:g52187.t1